MAKPVKPQPSSKPVKAFTVTRDQGGWRMTTYLIDGNEAVIEAQTEPDLKILALEAFKLAAYKWWTSL